MAGANDFKLFCNGVPGGTGNSLTPAAYAALTALLQGGFETGVAESIQANTVWRQATFMAAMLGQFISVQGFDALDDRSLTNITTAFRAALASYLQPAIPGQIVMYGGATVSSQWRHCRGQSVERVAYPDLFTAIGVLYGPGDNPGVTFALPDFRGLFPRAQDASRGFDPSRALGSFQTDGFAAHTHVVDLQPLNSSDAGGAGKVATGNNSPEGVIPPFDTSSSGITETRPKNLCVSFMIWIGTYSGTGTPI